MTPQQQLALEVFVNDPIIFPLVMETVKKKTEERLNRVVERIKQYPNLPLDLEESNERLGAQLKACAEGIHLVEAVFRELGQYKKQPKVEITRNPAR